MRKYQWIVGVCIAALVILSCLSVPVIAEKLLENDVDQVRTIDTVATDSDVVPPEVYRRKAAAAVDRIPVTPLSSDAISTLEDKARKAYLDTFGSEIPADYHSLDSFAAEEDGVMLASLSIMPPDWEASTSTLPQERDGGDTYYCFTFSNVDPQTGAGDVVGMQLFYLTFDFPLNEAQYIQAQYDAMEAKAREFAETLGLEPGEALDYDRVSGSFEPGLCIVFDLGEERTVSVTISELGEITGYSMIRAKG